MAGARPEVLSVYSTVVLSVKKGLDMVQIKDMGQARTKNRTFSNKHYGIYLKWVHRYRYGLMMNRSSHLAPAPFQTSPHPERVL